MSMLRFASLAFALLAANSASTTNTLKFTKTGTQTNIASTLLTGPITISNLQWSVQNAVTIGTPTTSASVGKAAFGKVVVTKAYDTTSPGLLTVCAAGAHFDTAEVVVGSTKYTFGTMWVTKIDVS